MNYCTVPSFRFTYTGGNLDPIVLEQVQLIGKILDENNKPLTDNVHAAVTNSAGDYIVFPGFQVDREGGYSLCGLKVNETYKLRVGALFLADTDTIKSYDYTPLTFTYKPDNTLPDIKVRVREIKR